MTGERREARQRGRLRLESDVAGDAHRESWDCEKYFEAGPFNSLGNGNSRAARRCRGCDA